MRSRSVGPAVGTGLRKHDAIERLGRQPLHGIAVNLCDDCCHAPFSVPRIQDSNGKDKVASFGGFPLPRPRTSTTSSCPISVGCVPDVGTSRYRDNEVVLQMELSIFGRLAWTGLKPAASISARHGGESVHSARHQIRAEVVLASAEFHHILGRRSPCGTGGRDE